ncbi:flagellar hook-length control protein FliK [Paraburkholderia sp. NMBU_R16]|uniref:flagellar hook-length control protein FliK n=1 Tax=Paraburkholderia sp. NMBU_R16 TaxID=2698676 RepID=UPI001563C880|nr:flagellar hook-length control protein FliK [Paraburkholderia sp. NMBU_R16]NRO95507.1 flagellar hook-length control protein FliK [Paraburkholderia sp. NMBU_R16]
MTGIDSRLATVLASRIDSLIDSVAAGSRTAAAQTGASTQASDMSAAPTLGAPLVDTPLPASAQATLSEVALTLDAISRLGGEATPAVLGETPIWPAPPAIDAQAGLPEGLFAATGAAGEPAAAVDTRSGSAAQTGANEPLAADGAASSGSVAPVASAASLPVAALAGALASTVAETGLFYESHLAQWLSGGYPAEALLKEPQARLAAETSQLSLPWSDADDAGFVSAGPQLSGWSGTAPDGGLPGMPVPPHAAAAQLLASALASQARSDAAGYAGARQVPGISTQVGTDSDKAAQAQTGSAARALQTADSAPGSIAASIHPATIPLVRQQLDLLATEQFRWSGEVWPGAKLDWTIEPDDPRRGRPGEADTDSEQAWRTRLTLTLPTLGTVDADLMLRGSQLIVRVQASAAGAARLATGGAAFGRRLEAAGIELAGLTVREIGGPTAGAASGAGQAATSAYARAAATAAEAQVHETTSASDRWEGAPAETATQSTAARAPHSPLDRLFDDPFDWSGA